MKQIKYTFWLLVAFVVLTSTNYSTKNETQPSELPPFNDSLFLNLPDEPYNYLDIEFPEHVIDFMFGWGTSPTVITAITNDGANLGRVLFYDVRLSGDNTLSCGSCHKQEFSFADNVALSDGIDDQLTNRNSSHLNDLLWQAGATNFFWDMRAWSLEDAVKQPILATNELGKNIPNLIAKLENTEIYPQLFNAAFGSPEINEDVITSALAQFILSMSSFESRFDKGYENNFADFTQSESNGQQLFMTNCSMCHISPHFGTGGGIFMPFPLMGTNGLDSVITDLGAGEWTQDPMMMGVFKGPTLKNIAVTAPYMHDGRFETLEEVIDFYSEGVQFNENSSFVWMFGDTFDGYHFNDQEKEDLVAFLHTLTDENLLNNEKWSNPWSATVNVNPLVESNPFAINLYPNPVNDFFKVEFKNPDFSTVKFDLYNINGQLVKSKKTNGSEIQFERGALPRGVYKLVLSNGVTAQTKKILLK